MSANGWGGTLSAVFGVGGSARGGASGERRGGGEAATVAGPGGLQPKQKADVRRQLPDWSAGAAREEVGQPNKEDGLEVGRGTQDLGHSRLDVDELDRLAAAILWQTAATTRRLRQAGALLGPRKNVQHVYVVGGGWWSSILVTLFSATLLSVKTIASRGKLAQCPSLSSLAESIGGKAFVHLDVPLEVYVANAAVEKQIKLHEVDDQLPRTFGVPLGELAGRNGKGLPRLVRDCLAVLSAEGPASVGIFRRSPSASTVSHLAAAYDRGHPVSLASAPDAPYIAASLLKKFIHDLPDPLILRDSWDAIKACPLDDDLAIPYLRTHFLPLLPPASRHLLSRLLSVLSAIAAEHDKNLMTSSNLVICLCPALMGGLGASRDELEMCRVPGMEVGSMRGLETIKRRERAGNTLGGVLRVLIDRQSDLVDPPELPA
ncbi:hypothetical protein JCM10296v2_007707 [Rhodotorula toruloides]